MRVKKVQKEEDEEILKIQRLLEETEADIVALKEKVKKAKGESKALVSGLEKTLLSLIQKVK